MKLILTIITTLFITISSQSTTIKPSSSLADLSVQLFNTIKNFSVDDDKRELFKNLRTQTSASIDLMKKNGVKVTADDVNKMVDELKSKLKEEGDLVIKDRGVDRFGAMLRDHLMQLVNNEEKN